MQARLTCSCDGQVALRVLLVRVLVLTIPALCSWLLVTIMVADPVLQICCSDECLA